MYFDIFESGIKLYATLDVPFFENSSNLFDSSKEGTFDTAYEWFLVLLFCEKYAPKPCRVNHYFGGYVSKSEAN